MMGIKEINIVTWRTRSWFQVELTNFLDLRLSCNVQAVGTYSGHNSSPTRCRLQQHGLNCILRWRTLWGFFLGFPNCYVWGSSDARAASVVSIKKRNWHSAFSLNKTGVQSDVSTCSSVLNLAESLELTLPPPSQNSTVIFIWWYWVNKLWGTGFLP